MLLLVILVSNVNDAPHELERVSQKLRLLDCHNGLLSLETSLKLTAFFFSHLSHGVSNVSPFTFLLPY